MHVCGRQRATFRSQFSRSTMWVLVSSCQVGGRCFLPAEPPHRLSWTFEMGECTNSQGYHSKDALGGGKPLLGIELEATEVSLTFLFQPTHPVSLFVCSHVQVCVHCSLHLSSAGITSVYYTPNFFFKMWV